MWHKPYIGLINLSSTAFQYPNFSNQFMVKKSPIENQGYPGPVLEENNL